MTDLLETHRWTRKIERNGSSREIRCLDCGAVVIWHAKESTEPIVGKVARCPGKIVVPLSQLPTPESLPPMGMMAAELAIEPTPAPVAVAIPCSAGHTSALTCEYCEPKRG